MPRVCETSLPASRPNDLNYQYYTYVLACLVGQSVTVRLRNNASFSGLFYSYNINSTPGSLENILVLKYAQQLATGDQLSGPVEDVIVIHNDDIVFISATHCLLTFDEAKPRTNTDFKTDSEISHGLRAGTERELQKWEPPSGDDPSLVLEMPAANDSKVSWGTSWNQFEVNARQFKVKSTYQEDFYTTPLDVGSIPEFVKEKANQIAREIEASNHHINDKMRNDEEARFGAVRGTGAYAFNAPVKHQSAEAPQPYVDMPPESSRPTVVSGDSVQEGTQIHFQKGKNVQAPAKSTDYPEALSVEGAVERPFALSRFRAKKSGLPSLKDSRIPGYLFDSRLMEKLPFSTGNDLISDHSMSRMDDYFLRTRHGSRPVDRVQEKKNFIQALETIRERMARIDWSASSSTRRTGTSTAIAQLLKKMRNARCVKMGDPQGHFHQMRENLKRVLSLLEDARAGKQDGCAQCREEEASGPCRHGGSENKSPAVFQPFKTGAQYGQPIDSIMKTVLLNKISKEDPVTAPLLWNADVDPSEHRLKSYNEILYQTPNDSSGKGLLQSHRSCEPLTSLQQQSTAVETTTSLPEQGGVNTNSKAPQSQAQEQHSGIASACPVVSSAWSHPENTDHLQRFHGQRYNGNAGGVPPHPLSYNTVRHAVPTFAYIPTPPPPPPPPHQQGVQQHIVQQPGTQPRVGQPQETQMATTSPVPAYISNAYPAAFVTQFNGNYYVIPRHAFVPQNAVEPAYVDDGSLTNSTNVYTNAIVPDSIEVHPVLPPDAHRHHCKPLVVNHHVHHDTTEEYSAHLRGGALHGSQNLTRHPTHFAAQPVDFSSGMSTHTPHIVTVTDENNVAPFLPCRTVLSTGATVAPHPPPSSTASSQAPHVPPTEYAHGTDSQVYAEMYHGPVVTTPVQWIVPVTSPGSCKPDNQLQHEPSTRLHSTTAQPLPATEQLTTHRLHPQQIPFVPPQNHNRLQIHVAYPCDNTLHAPYSYSTALDSSQQQSFVQQQHQQQQQQQQQQRQSQQPPSETCSFGRRNTQPPKPVLLTHDDNSNNDNSTNTNNCEVLITSGITMSSSSNNISSSHVNRVSSTKGSSYHEQGSSNAHGSRMTSLQEDYRHGGPHSQSINSAVSSNTASKQLPPDVVDPVIESVSPSAVTPALLTKNDSSPHTARKGS